MVSVLMSCEGGDEEGGGQEIVDGGHPLHIYALSTHYSATHVHLLHNNTHVHMYVYYSATLVYICS